MKKLILMLAVFASTTAMAQEDIEDMGQSYDSSASVPANKHSVATNSFWSNWFVQGNVGMSSFRASQEKDWGYSKSLFKDFRSSAGVSLALGKWFTPSLGLRTKLNGFWGRSIISKNKSDNESKYWTLQEQVLVNLSNMLYGYNPTRLYSFIPYVGAGVMRSMTYNEYAGGISLGLLNTFRLSDRVALNLDINYGIYEENGDGMVWDGEYTGHDIIIGKQDRHSHDKVFNIEVGITYNIGKKRFKSVPDEDAIRELTEGQIDAINAQLEDMKAENERLQQELDGKQQQEPSDPSSEHFNP